MVSFEELTGLACAGPLEALVEGARGHDLSRRDARGRTLLHHAAAAANEAACVWLLAQGVDAGARDDQRRSAADCVYRGDPSCDPEDVSAWRSLREFLLRAERAAQGEVVVEDAPAELPTEGLREWTRRRFGPLARQGGGSRIIRCLSAAREGDGWRFEGRVESAYAGTNPAHDPPWEQVEAVALSLDDTGWVR